MYLDRLKKYGDTLHCVVTLTEELALAAGRRGRREIKAGKYRGPLHGIPWGAKDLLATKGIKTTWGATPYKNQVIDVDATVVERLRDAGAVLVAKLSMGALAQGGVWFGGIDAQPVEHRDAARADRRPAPAPRRPPASSASRSAPRRAARSSRRRSPAASPACGRPTAASAATARWRSAGRWTRSGRCAGASKTARSCSTRSTAADGRDDTVVDAPFDWNPDAPLVDAAHRLHRERVRRAPHGREPDATRSAETRGARKDA